jgi:hypothetical protein
MDLASSSAKVNDVVVEDVAPTTYERTRTTK